MSNKSVLRELYYKIFNNIDHDNPGTIRTQKQAILARTGKDISVWTEGLDIITAKRPVDGSIDYGISIKNPKLGWKYMLYIGRHDIMNCEYVNSGEYSDKPDLFFEIPTQVNPDESITASLTFNSPLGTAGITVLCIGTSTFKPVNDAYAAVTSIFNTDYEPADDVVKNGIENLISGTTKVLSDDIMDISMAHTSIAYDDSYYKPFYVARGFRSEEKSILLDFLKEKARDWDTYARLQEEVYSHNMQDSTGTGYPYDSDEGETCAYIEGTPYAKTVKEDINVGFRTLYDTNTMLIAVEIDEYYKIIDIYNPSHQLFMDPASGALTDRLQVKGITVDRNNQCTNILFVVLNGVGFDMKDTIIDKNQICINNITKPNRYGTYIEPTIKSVLKKVLDTETKLNYMESQLNSNYVSFQDWLRELSKLVSDGTITDKTQSDSILALVDRYGSVEEKIVLASKSVSDLNTKVVNDLILIDSKMTEQSDNIKNQKILLDEHLSKKDGIFSYLAVGLSITSLALNVFTKKRDK